MVELLTVCLLLSFLALAVGLHRDDPHALSLSVILASWVLVLAVAIAL